jgi:hypothetical protein
MTTKRTRSELKAVRQRNWHKRCVACGTKLSTRQNRSIRKRAKQGIVPGLPKITGVIGDDTGKAKAQ